MQLFQGRIGTVVVVLSMGLPLFFWINGLLSGGKHYTVLFKDAKGIKTAELVRMAGIDVGQISTVKPDAGQSGRTEGPP